MSKVVQLSMIDNEYKVLPVDGEVDILIFHRLCSLLLPDVGVPSCTEMWLAWDSAGQAVGFCSAKIDSNGDAYFSSAGVGPCANGKGLQRKMIKVRLDWAKSNDCKWAYTYASKFNRASVVNLIKSGFEWYDPEAPYVGKKFEYFRYKLNGDSI